ncbi:unnamed protein product [Periconia digitata]|uniref:Uncharacterized protein n=1 Tax=Periconia digitata TaxID=1303443 RepID=A0A9W4U4W5_9PLEO|nr:unnamed protein product [Periconia digitata]
MSTTYLSIYDLLRITYTYESQAMEGDCQRPSSRHRSESQVSSCSTPELCMHVAASTTPSMSYAELETDFTDLYAKKKRDSCVSMT